MGQLRQTNAQTESELSQLRQTAAQALSEGTRLRTELADKPATRLHPADLQAMLAALTPTTTPTLS